MPTTRALRIRLYPTPEQEAMFRRISGCCRLVYNLALEQRRDFWRAKRAATGRGFGWYDQNNELPALKAAAPFLREVPAHCLQSALRDLDQAFTRFFSGQAGLPKPRRKLRHDGFTFPDPKQIRVDVAGGRLVLPKFGKTGRDHGALRARFHRVPYGTLQRVSVVRDGDHWYAALVMRTRRSAPRRRRAGGAEAIGVDRGVAIAFMTSAGEALDMPTPGPRQRRRERRLARDVARKQRGSANRRRAVRALARHRAKAARRRRDRLHKITDHLAKNHGVVVIEGLDVRQMTASARGTAAAPGSRVAQKAGLNREVLARGWGIFRQQLAYKLAWAGGRMIEVPPSGTSQTCAACGTRCPDSRRSQDRFVCVVCGHADNADRNAAYEIRRRGLRRLDDRDPPEGTVGAARGVLCDGMAMKREEKKIGVNPARCETG